MSRKTLVVILFFFCQALILPAAVMAMPGAKANGHGQAMDERVVNGMVKETMDAAGYTYMLVESSGSENWVAIPKAPVTVGSTIAYAEGMVMKDFTSKTLGKTFTTIIFSPGLRQVEQAPAAAKEKPSDDSFAAAIEAEQQDAVREIAPLGQETSGGSLGAIVPFTELSIEKVAAENGYQVGEIFADAKKLAGEKIQIRGQVVKFSPMIMGRNWVHLQDGTGDPMHNSHDLVVTTDEEVGVGSVVVFEGIVSADKDFGAGYKYQVIVEQASLIN